MRLGSLLLAAAVACGAESSPTTPSATPTPNPSALAMYFPPVGSDAWETVSARALGWDSTALSAALDWAGSNGTTAMIVLWRGRIVTERYWRGWTPTTDSIIASAGKSISGFLVGQLKERGQVVLDERAARYLGNGWSRSPLSEGRITVRHLLSMASGLDDSLRFAAEPGTRFYYNNPAYYQLFGVMTNAAGATINPLSRLLLWDRVGMRNSSWVPFIDTGEPGFVMRASARDMARFGLLVLNRGRWMADTLLRDTTYMREMLASSTTSNPSYGFLWWLNGKSQHRIPGPMTFPTQTGSIIPSAPSDLVAALGKGDKKIYVSPLQEVVVVRHGDEADGAGSGNPFAASGFDEQLWQRLKGAMKY